MRRHASPEDLASLDLGGLKPRKAHKIQAHLASCVICTETTRQLTVVQMTLASVSYPAMSEQFCVRIETVLAAESAQRVASAPAGEAGRRVLPERSRRSRASRGGRHLPGMSVLATRLAAAVALVIVVGVGGYEIASHAGGNVAGTAASSRGSVAAPGALAGQMSFGPSVRYGEPSSTKDIRTVTSNTNFTSASLGSQALAAVQAARLRQGTAGQATGGANPSAQANSSAKSAQGTAPGTPSTSQLAGCLDGLVGNHTVLLVEEAKFEGKPATIIVTAATGNREAEVWAVGPSCTAAHPDVLAHQSLART